MTKNKSPFPSHANVYVNNFSCKCGLLEKRGKNHSKHRIIEVCIQVMLCNEILNCTVLQCKQEAEMLHTEGVSYN